MIDKYALAFAFLLVVCGNTNAQEEGFFIGGSILSTSMASTVEGKVFGITTRRISASDRGSGFGIQGGYNFDSWRLYAVSSQSSLGGFDTSTLLIIANWVHDSGFFIGGGAGSATMKWTQDILDYKLKGKSSSSGGAVFELGGVYNFTDALRLDGGLRSVGVELETTLSIDGGGEVIATGESIGHVWIGLQYIL